MERKVDVAIIGAGSAGLAALSQVRRAGKSFVLIDGGELGTTCARVGCMPSKAAIQVAEDFHRRLHMGRIGVSGLESLRIDASEAMEHVRDLRDIFVDRVLSGTTDEMGDEFIAGDATGSGAILHEAVHEGRIAGYNAVHDKATAFRRFTPLAITFCDPNIVTVGQTWPDLDEEAVIAGELRFGPVSRALILGKNNGILRVYADRGSARLLGAAMVAPHGEHLGHLLAWSIQQGLSVFDVLKLPFYHPVVEEALQAVLRSMAERLGSEAPGAAGLDPVSR